MEKNGANDSSAPPAVAIGFESCTAEDGAPQGVSAGPQSAQAVFNGSMGHLQHFQLRYMCSHQHGTQSLIEKLVHHPSAVQWLGAHAGPLPEMKSPSLPRGDARMKSVSPVSKAAL